MLDINDFDSNAITLGAVTKNSRNNPYVEVLYNGKDAIETKLRVGGDGLVAPFGAKPGEFADESTEKIAMALNADADLEAFAKGLDGKAVGLLLPRSKDAFGKPRNELELRDKQTPLFREAKEGYPPKVNLKVRVAQKKDKYGKLVGKLTRIDFATLDPGATAYRYVPGTADQIPINSRIIAECRLGPIWTNATKNWGITLEAMHVLVFPPPPEASAEDKFGALPAPPVDETVDMDDDGSSVS
eukprot:4671582-Prymnesium_polylepis.2